MRRRIPILMYHRVGRPGPRARLRGMYTSARVLDRHLAYLAKCGFTTCDFGDLGRAARGECALPERPVLLTFDDGHLDNHSEGLPVLRAHGAKATVFVIVGDVGCRGLVWPGAAESEPTDLFDWDQAAELQEHGVSIEVHGWEHRSMVGVPATDLARELSACRSVLRERLGCEPSALAYPFGAWDASCAMAARDAGFEFACTTRRGVADLDLDDSFALPRIPVRGYRWIHELRFRLALKRAGR